MEEISLKKEESKKLILSLKINLESILEKSIKIYCGTNQEQINYEYRAKKRTILLISATNLLKNIKSRHLMGTIVLIVRYFL